MNTADLAFVGGERENWAQHALPRLRKQKMKKCRRCSKPATLHVTEIQEGDAKIIHLCDTCARKYLDEETENSPGNPTSEFAAELEALVTEDDDSAQRCSNCDVSFGEFREQGRLGCPTCYEEFRTELTPLLENIHEEVLHMGKRPLRSPTHSVDQSRLIQLRHRQKEAIDSEDYELAAQLRDEIADIETSLKNVEGDSPEPE